MTSQWCSVPDMSYDYTWIVGAGLLVLSATIFLYAHIHANRKR